MAGEQEKQPPKLDRREALTAIGVWSVVGVMAATLGVPGIRFFVGSSLEPEAEHWVEAGPVEELSPSTFQAVRYRFRSKDAWREVERKGLLYVRSREDGSILALSAVCTHLGCLVRWREADQIFACPCHVGIYDAEGNVVSGPPPRPLEHLATKVDNGTLLVKV